ncbi:MAG: translocation/assembly module TamB domain-containing protein [Verrucomicrobiota bacterium]
MPDLNDPSNTISKKPRGCLFRLLRLGLLSLVVLFGVGIWLNGPGVRWLGPKIVTRYLEKAGFEVDLKVSGTFLGGLDFSDVELRSDGLVAKLNIDHLDVDYVMGEILKGKIRNIKGDGVNLDIHLLEAKEESKRPVNFQELSKALAVMRERLMPMGLDFQDVNVRVIKSGERILDFEGGTFKHLGGQDQFELVSGKVTDATGRSSLPQRAEIQWLENELRLDQLELLPEFGVQDFVLKLPENGEVEVLSQFRLEDAMFDLVVEPGFKEARVKLMEGSLDLKKSMDGLGFKLPLTGRVNSFSMVATDLYPIGQQRKISATGSLTDASYADWNFPIMDVILDLDPAGKLTAKFDGVSMNTAFSIFATSETINKSAEVSVFPSMEGEIKIQRAAEFFIALQQKYNWKMDFSRFPESQLSGKLKLDLNGGFQSVAGDLSLDALDPNVVPLRLIADFSDKQLNVKSFTAEGLEISGNYHFGNKTYEELTQFDNFWTEIMRPWVEGTGVEWAGSGIMNGGWEGSGDFTNKIHKGKTSDFSVEWQARGRPLVSGSGEFEYAWPGDVKVAGWVIKSEGQQIELDATIHKDLLTLSNFKWFDGKDRIAIGSGKISLPENVNELKSWISKDEGVLDFKLKSEVIALSKLRPWVGGFEQLDPASTGEVEIELSGGFAAPEVKASLWLRDIKSVAHPLLPSADVIVNFQTKAGMVNTTAEVLIEDYPPASFVASMPFLPKKWVEQPGSFEAERITGKLLLPRLELSRIQALIPQAKEVSGKIDGYADISGTVGNPIIMANLDLSNGRVRMKTDTIPDFEGVSLNLKSDMKQIKIKGSVNDLSGGSITIDGALDYNRELGLNGSQIDFNVRGRGVPLKRNEYLIMRSHMDLKVNGRLDTARVSGTVGIIDSVIYKDIEFIPIGKPFLEPKPAKLPAVDVGQKVKLKVPEAFGKWTADIAVKTVDPILIRGNLGEGEIDVAVRIGGNLGDPIPNGNAKMRNALVRLPLTTLRVRESVLTFNELTRFDPNIEIRADASSRPYEVDIYAYGRASDPQLVLTSQPPLPKEEIMTLLATGTTSAGLEDSQLAASRATQLLIEELRRGTFRFGKHLRPLLSVLDEVDFNIAEPDPYSSTTFNTATMKLSKRWSVSAGVSEDGDQRVMTTWKYGFK